MNSEIQRLRSFEKWNYPVLDKTQMARTGLFADEQGVIKCNFCDYTLTTWDDWMDELEEHQKYSPYCEIFHQPRENEPHNHMILRSIVAPFALQTRNLRIAIFGIHHTHLSDELLFSDTNSRRNSYLKATPSLKRMKNQLAHAGFHYPPEMTYCFRCHLGTARWNNRASPLIVHALASPYCPYLLATQSVDFINAVYNLRSQVINTMIKPDSTSPSVQATYKEHLAYIHHKLMPLIKKEIYVLSEVIEPQKPQPNSTNVHSTKEMRSPICKITPPLRTDEVLPPSPLSSKQHSGNTNILLPSNNKTLPTVPQTTSTGTSTSYSTPLYTSDRACHHTYNVINYAHSSKYISECPSSSTSVTVSPPPLPPRNNESNSYFYPNSPKDVFSSIYTINYHINNYTEITDFLSIQQYANTLYDSLELSLKSNYIELFNSHFGTILSCPQSPSERTTDFDTYEKCFNYIHQNTSQTNDCLNIWNLLSQDQKHKYQLMAFNNNQRLDIKHTINKLRQANYYLKPSKHKHFYDITLEPSQRTSDNILTTLKNRIQNALHTICTSEQNKSDFFPLYTRNEEYAIPFDDI